MITIGRKRRVVWKMGAEPRYITWLSTVSISGVARCPASLPCPMTIPGRVPDHHRVQGAGSAAHPVSSSPATSSFGSPTPSPPTRALAAPGLSRPL